MAAASGFFYDESFVCSTSASLASSQFTLVSLSTGSTINGRAPIVLCASATQGVSGLFGVLQDTPNVGRAGDVRILGVSKVVCTTSAGVPQGSLITSNALGQAIVADTSGQLVIGKALSGSTSLAVGALIDVLITGPYPLGLV